jgi:hypothetical protein
MTIDSLMLGYILELKQHKKENLKLDYVKENPTIMSEYVAMTQQYQALGWLRIPRMSQICSAT